MKQRLDKLLVDRGLATDQKTAGAIILAGEVRGADRVLDKPGTMVEPDTELNLKTHSRYVSRGGDKLASVAKVLGLDFQAKVVLDAGASTGGFTDYALQHGATKVYAVDVGSAQLDYRLRKDARVVSVERTDIRELELPEPVDIIVMDLSFISLTKVLEQVGRFLKADGIIVVLAKPQFEASKALADQYKGVIPEPERSRVLMELEAWLNDQFKIVTQADSGMAGAQGNVERFYKLILKH